MVKETARSCSVCGQNGHNSRTCDEKVRRVKLFGVNIKVDAQRDEEDEPAHRERKKGKPWTEKEHQLFLTALEKIGRGNWKRVSMEYVTSKTPTQVASHAQKFFIRQQAALTEKKNRRPSVFDWPSHESATTSSNGQIVNELPSSSLDTVIIPMASAYRIPDYHGLHYMGTSNVPFLSYIDATRYHQVLAYLLRYKSYQTKFNSCGASTIPPPHQSRFQTASTSFSEEDDSLELKIGPPQPSRYD